MNIQDQITDILHNNKFAVNTVIVNTWTNFLNYSIQYNNNKNDIMIALAPKQRLLDFYRDGFLRLKELKNKINLLNLPNKQQELFVKHNVDIIINNFLKNNLTHIKELI